MSVRSFALKFVVTLFYINPSLCCLDVREYGYIREPGYVNVEKLNGSLYTRANTDRVKCVVLCATHMRCVSVFHSQRLLQCVMHATVFKPLDSDSHRVWQYWYRRGHEGILRKARKELAHRQPKRSLQPTQKGTPKRRTPGRNLQTPGILRKARKELAHRQPKRSLQPTQKGTPKRRTPGRNLQTPGILGKVGKELAHRQPKRSLERTKNGKPKRRTPGRNVKTPDFIKETRMRRWQQKKSLSFAKTLFRVLF